MVLNGLDFILLLIIDKVRQWSREVLPVLLCLLVRCEEGGMEGGIYGLLRQYVTSF
jgi:hypothetical protein